MQLEHDGEVAGHSRFGFQFHKGAIRTPATLDASGKVTLFQFHYGSIRTDYSNAENGDYCEFQFHYGSIRTMNAYTSVGVSVVSIP